MTQTAGGEFSAVRPARLLPRTAPKGTAMSNEEAVQAEAEGVETATVTWRDLTPFEIPRYRMDWPFAAVVAAEQEQWPTFLNELLPNAALVEFRSLRPTQRDAFELLDAVSKALGFSDSGESPASAK